MPPGASASAQQHPIRYRRSHRSAHAPSEAAEGLRRQAGLRAGGLPQRGWELRNPRGAPVQDPGRRWRWDAAQVAPNLPAMSRYSATITGTWAGKQPL
jgi:hypothetical protein